MLEFFSRPSRHAYLRSLLGLGRSILFTVSLQRHLLLPMVLVLGHH